VGPADPEAKREFGRRVSGLRTAEGLTVRQLAAKCGVHWTYLAQIDRGEGNPSLVVVLSLARALRIDAGELVRGMQGRGRGQASLFE
jgi:transcriptional regulator with XRE-family HTH domain